MPDPIQDELNLFVFNELERLNLLVERLQSRGVVHPADLAVAELKARLKQEGRKLRMHRDLGEPAEDVEAAIRELEAQIGRLRV